MVLRTRAHWWGVTLDAPGDVRELARFYSRLLAWQLFEDGTGDSASVAPSQDAGYNLGFQRAPTSDRSGPPNPGIRRCRCTSRSKSTIWTRQLPTRIASGPSWRPISPSPPCESYSSPRGTLSACTSTDRARFASGGLPVRAGFSLDPPSWLLLNAGRNARMPFWPGRMCLAKGQIRPS